MITTEQFAENTAVSQNSPLVSIIVPVYNVEKTLYHCLASAVYQTLPETEVIVVNDASPDNSQAIIDEFESRFPDKVRCIIHSENQGLSYARRTGLRNARAPYVVFLDSDDFITGDLCEILYSQISEEGLDLLYYPATRFWEGSQKFDSFNPPKDASQDVMIREGLAMFAGAMYSKEYLLAHEDIAFLKMLFEDAATTPALMSRTDRIGVYRKKPLYFYRYGRIGSICASQMTERKMHDTFAANTIGLENVSSEFMGAYTYRAVKRAVGIMAKETAIYDYGVVHVKDLAERTKVYADSLTDSEIRMVTRAQEQPDEISIPKIVYVNGFIRNELKDFDRYVKEATRAYLFDPEVVILDESTCDMAALPDWLKAATKEEQGLYFAVQTIAEKGGIYISPAVQITSSFNREAFCGAFFVAGPETTVLPCVFGAAPVHPAITVLKNLLDRESVAWQRNNIADCMAHVLIGECGVHLTGLEEKGLHNLHMLRFCDVCCGLHADKSYCTLNYNNYLSNIDGVSVLPQRLMDFAWSLAAAELADTESSLMKAKEDAKKARRNARELQSDLDDIRNNFVFRIIRIIWNLLPQKVRELIRK